MAQYVRQTLLPSALPVGAVNVLAGFLLGKDDGYETKDRINAAIDILGYGLTFAVDSAVKGFSATEPVAFASDKEAAEALQSFASADASEGLHAAAVPPWLIPLVLELLTRFLVKK